MTTTNRFSTLALAAALGAATMTSALAAPEVTDFKTYDSNGDGKVSIEEFKAHGGQESAFKAGDANNDGVLSHDEFVKSAANNDRAHAGKYANDAWLTTKIKTLMLKDEGVKGLDVDVETHNGTVQLAGWVKTPAQATQAEKIARSVKGVKDVKNDLQVKRD